MGKDNILELKNIYKIYPGVKALDDVSISFKKGEIHAIVGENGAGKSTLIKIITGAIEPTGGLICYEGIDHKKFDPKESINSGICAVYQEFNLVPFLSVAENVFLGHEIKDGIFYDLKTMRIKTEEIMNDLGISLNVKTQVKDLSVGYQQIVEIAKSVSRNIKLLILEEPTAPLTNQEIKFMFKIVRALKEKGVTIIYISHRLEEIFEISDRVTVMRDGEYVSTMSTEKTNRRQLISMMVGRSLGEDYPVRSEIVNNETILEVDNLNSDYIHDISFRLNKGEILGFAGLVGAGRTEVARAIYGADPVNSGKVLLNGEEVKIKKPRDAIKLGIGLIPEDRKRQGILKVLTVAQNISLGSLKSLFKNGFIINKKEKKYVEKYVESLSIKTPSLNQLVVNLSGGNQQKVVLAKWLATHCDVFIFDEPTRGIDVGAKQEIYKLMNSLSREGKAIIMISSEMPELLGMSDRIIIMNQGYIAGIVNKNEATQEFILDMASKEGVVGK